MCTVIMYVYVFQCVDTSVSKSLIFETEGVLACVRVLTKYNLRLHRWKKSLQSRFVKPINPGYSNRD
jgi:hypothetical protein